MIRTMFIVVIAPIGAVVLVGSLLLFGVKPHTVFLAGFTVKYWLEAAGFHPTNRVGVLTTVIFWWIVIVAIGLLWDRRRRS